MRTCPECGTANAADDDFCGSCGSYLGWSPAPPGPSTGGGTPPAGPPRPEPQPAAPDAPRGEAGRPAAGAAGRDAPPDRAPDSGAAAPRPAPHPPAPAAPGSPPPARPEREPDPVAVRPARPAAPRPVVRPSAVDDAAVGPSCPACGTPNQPGRRFCRRCAAALTGRSVAAPPPWWRTRWPFRRRVRIGGSGNALRRALTLLVIAAVAAAAILLYPREHEAYETLRDKLGGAHAISPTAVTASAAVRGHPASAAADGLTNRYWGAPRIGDSVTFTFRSPFRLVDLLVHTGDSTDPQRFRREARPTALELVAVESGGGRRRQRLDLDDKPGSQRVVTGISDVVRVTLVIRGAAGTGPGRDIALGEVEFFERG